VPTAISWPGKIKAGTASQKNMLTMDIYPTLLEIAGLDTQEGVEGISFLQELMGENGNDQERSFYFTRREGNTRYGGQAVYALRQGDWKLLQNSPYEPYELYNLKNDPKEEKNVISENEEKYRELNEILMQHIQAGGRVPWQK
jgi:arylsulfatase A-like enzyme